jgi:hypothetical protein
MCFTVVFFTNFKKKHIFSVSKDLTSAQGKPFFLKGFSLFIAFKKYIFNCFCYIRSLYNQ